MCSPCHMPSHVARFIGLVCIRHATFLLNPGQSKLKELWKFSAVSPNGPVVFFSVGAGYGRGSRGCCLCGTAVEGAQACDGQANVARVRGALRLPFAPCQSFCLAPIQSLCGKICGRRCLASRLAIGGSWLASSRSSRSGSRPVPRRIPCFGCSSTSSFSDTAQVCPCGSDGRRGKRYAGSGDRC